jgi:hypothetical protein
MFGDPCQEILPSIELLVERMGNNCEVMKELMKLELIVAVASIAVVTLLGHNLLCYRKQGWGWTTLTVLAGVMAFMGKLAVAMFCEVSAGNEITDWDE